MTPVAAGRPEPLRALVLHGDDFVVAAQIHGWRGATADLDIAVSTDDSNVERLNRALATVGAGSGTIGAFGTVFRDDVRQARDVRRAHAIGQYATGFVERGSIDSVTDWSS